VPSIKDLTNIIIPHFDKYCLLTQKGADFILFKQIVLLMNQGCHLSIEGLQQIINIKASINLGISENIKSEFHSIIPVTRPIIDTEQIPDPQWILGFVEGEGSFDISIYSSKGNVGFGVKMRFRIPQHERDPKLIEILKNYFGSGNIEKHTKAPSVTLVIVRFSVHADTIIPFFERYPLIGEKRHDFDDWCKVFLLMKDGSHLTVDGLSLIRQIKSGMNNGRIK